MFDQTDVPKKDNSYENKKKGDNNFTFSPSSEL